MLYQKILGGGEGSYRGAGGGEGSYGGAAGGGYNFSLCQSFFRSLLNTNNLL